MKNQPAAPIISKFRRLLKYQTLLIGVGSIVSIIGGIWLAVGAFGMTLIAIPAAMVIAFALFNIIEFLSAMILKRIFYGGDTESFLKDADSELLSIDDQIGNKQTGEDGQPTNPQVSISIVDSSPVYARYQDADIFEWIDVEFEGKDTVRMFFIGTANMKSGIINKVPEDCILMEPGILYGTQAALDAHPA